MCPTCHGLLTCWQTCGGIHSGPGPVNTISQFYCSSMLLFRENLGLKYAWHHLTIHRVMASMTAPNRQKVSVNRWNLSELHKELAVYSRWSCCCFNDFLVNSPQRDIQYLTFLESDRMWKFPSTKRRMPQGTRVSKSIKENTTSIRICWPQ